MRDIVTPVLQEEVKTVIRRCLEHAALVNYQRLSEYAKVEGTFSLLPGFPHIPEHTAECCSTGCFFANSDGFLSTFLLKAVFK